MLRISRVKIRNYRSIKNAELEFDDRNVIAGENNTGKSNLISAISQVFSRTKNIDTTDFYFSNLHENIIIDVMLQEFDSQKYVSFTTQWYGIFGDKVVPYKSIDSVTIRFVGSFDSDTDQFIVDRKIISNYDDLSDNQGSVIPKDFYTCFSFIYVSSERDLSADIKQKNSYFSKMINSIRTTVSPGDKTTINLKLEEINTLIMGSFPKLREIEEKLEQVGTILEKDNNVSISPVPKNIDELKESIQILLEYNNSSSLPITNFGDGTKSWLSILSIVKGLDLQRENNAMSFLPFASTLLIEEPESHLHSNAQKKVWNQLNEVIGQIIITTHSGDIIAESGINHLIIAHIENLETFFTKPDYSNIDSIKLMKIMNQIVETKSGIIFANKVVLVEGITEIILFRGLFESLFGRKAHQYGLSIIRVDGKDNFPLFMDFLQQINKPYYLFADSDANVKVSQHATEKGYDISKLFFTTLKDIEETLFEVFKTEVIELFWRTTTWQHISHLIQTKQLNQTIIDYLHNNKTNYPYALLQIFNEQGKDEIIRLSKKDAILDGFLEIIGKEFDIVWN